MTLVQETRKPGKLTKSETKKRNEMLKQMHESGDFVRLKKAAYARLMVHPEGDAWRKEILYRTREAVERSNGGTDSIEEITLDELSDTIVRHGVGGIPASVRGESLSGVRKACRSHELRR
eukprot:CAMPEP_0201117524 /NCGR_PEP_ID=MMETSP0850-20130426/1489_1 /ASSEMBLY_ACC=CAM_ASM_000622 /TAXON_ID=183588 /ORGANISM="Pseudo-nitzschia fraudulenta, Strain WWA7" /LENGTH=119 /DNA_ID=CAMNT_0047381901 /DNA_START=99 /DNA_END=458 /DNA_ORIENTATION=-